MHRARMIAVLCLILGLIVTGLILQYVAKLRASSQRETCLNHFRVLGQFAGSYHVESKKYPTAAVPAGTIVTPGFSPEQRLSWVVDSLPQLNQKYQNTAEVYSRFQVKERWDTLANLDAGQHRINALTIPGAMHDDVSLTQIVGLAGVGPDGPTLSLDPLSNRAGCFRYDQPTPLILIADHDGTSQTLLFADTAREPGPWSRGGFSTVRPLLIDKDSPPALGGQFGGHYSGITAFGYADGSARFVLNTMHPEVLRNMMTIAGKGYDITPGE